MSVPVNPSRLPSTKQCKQFLFCRGTAWLSRWADRPAPWVGPERYQLRNDARRFETWETNYSTRLGLGAAADYAMNIGLERIRSRYALLAASSGAALEKSRVCGYETLAGISPRSSPSLWTARTPGKR